MAEKLQIFISSPGDVADERRRAALVIKRLNREFARFFDLQAVLWEREAMRASGHFQDVIVPPSATDIVVVILCARLGVPLPERTAVRQYCGLDGRIPVTGTEWEFEDALRANRECAVPELLVYRKPAAAAAVTIQADRLDEAKAQLLALEAFWRRHFIDDRGGFKTAFNQFETLDVFEEQLEQHLRQLLRARLPSLAAGSEPADTEIAWHQGSPFRGLQVFDAAHEEIFYGRDRAARAVIEALVRQASIGTAFVLVLGASGSGKSSLVRAGVVPKLMAPGVVTGVEVWRSCVFKPSEATGDLVAALAQALIGQSNALPELPATGIDLSDVITQLRAAAVLPLKLGLRQAALAMPRPAGAPVPEARLVLVIDQLEELFTLGEITAEQRANFVALMAALAKSGVVWVLATMRSDLYHRCAELPELVDLAAGEGQYHLTTPRPAELDQMIRLPAAAAGIDFEIHPETGIALNAALLEAAGRDPAALPLLEFTLDELYRQDIEARHGSRLTYESYTALDGLEGAIAARADAACRGLPPSQAAALPGLLSALVTVGEDSDLATARVVPRADLATTPVRTALLDILVRERLLVADKDRTGPVIRLTHEALLSHWPLLKALVDRDRDFLRVRARLQADRARWQAEGHSQDLLLPAGKRLEEAKEVLKARRDEIDAATAGFIEGSIERDRQLRQRSLRRTRAVAAVMAALAVIAGGFGWYSYDRSIEAETARQQAERNFNNAINAADTLGTEVSRSLRPLAGIKGVSAETVRQILTKAEGILGELTAEAQNLPNLKDRQAVQDRQARMFVEFAKTYAGLGNTDKQLERAKEANRIMKGLVAQDSGNLAWQHDLAASHQQLGNALQDHGELADALDNHRACQSLMERLSTQAPDNQEWQEWQRLLSTCMVGIGGILSEWGERPPRHIRSDSAQIS